MKNDNNSIIFFGPQKRLKSLLNKNITNAGNKVTIKRGWLAKESPKTNENRIRILKVQQVFFSWDDLTRRKINNKVKKMFKV